MEKAESTERKVLLFGFDDLRSILAVKSGLEKFGAELIPVAKADYGKTLSVLAGLEEAPPPEDDIPLDGQTKPTPPGVAFPGRMAVLCGLDEQLDEILPAFSNAGAGESCLKAVLTRYNRTWSASRLYMELSRERSALSPDTKK